MRSRQRPLVRGRAKPLRLALLVLLPLFGACSSIGYYSQAVSGHLKLMWSREPIAELLADSKTDAELRDKLETLLEARAFAVEMLALPDNDSYSSYVETGRDAVTWNVVAAGEFSVRARQWCFPIAGCVNYRGYFDERDAERYADGLSEQGFDVTIGGASAYSTLGWFDDPILDTMLRGSDLRFIGTLFHELAHQVLYVKDDSDFNEAYASFVEQQGVREWLGARRETDRIEAYNAFLDRGEDFVALLGNTRQSLAELYARDLSADDKRQGKSAIFERMREDYEQLVERWDGYRGYDRWFARELNNARLVAVATYRRHVPAFAMMFEEAGRDFEAFHALARSIGELDPEIRQKRMAVYLDSATAANTATDSRW